eukprot:scaffold307_cov162-Amphora_coffeaeformis.AAC.20
MHVCSFLQCHPGEEHSVDGRQEKHKCSTFQTKTAIAGREERTVEARKPNSSSHSTVMLGYCANGYKFPSYIIYKKCRKHKLQRNFESGRKGLLSWMCLQHTIESLDGPTNNVGLGGESLKTILFVKKTSDAVDL